MHVDERTQVWFGNTSDFFREPDRWAHLGAPGSTVALLSAIPGFPFRGRNGPYGDVGGSDVAQGWEGVCVAWGWGKVLWGPHALDPLEVLSESR